MSQELVTITLGVISAVFGGGAMHLFNYLRNTKKDTAKAQQNMQEQSQVQLMSVWNTLTKEQQEWRGMLMHRINELESKLTDLTVEKNQLIIRIGELETHNKELMIDNEELRQKVTDLTAELRKHTEKAVA